MSRTVSELAQQLNRLNARDKNFPSLILMTDSKRKQDFAKIIPKLPAHSLIIIRHFSAKEKYNLFKKIKYISRKFKVKLSVSDDMKFALRHNLDGVHFPEKTTKKTAACGKIKRAKPDMFLTSACHSKTALIAAQKLKLDAVLISPVFPTYSHPFAISIYVKGFQRISRRSQIKCYALGGINTKTTQKLLSTRACGVAGVSELV